MPRDYAGTPYKELVVVRRRFPCISARCRGRWIEPSEKNKPDIYCQPYLDEKYDDAEGHPPTAWQRMCASCQGKGVPLWNHGRGAGAESPPLTAMPDEEIDELIMNTDFDKPRSDRFQGFHAAGGREFSLSNPSLPVMAGHDWPPPNHPMNCAHFEKTSPCEARK